HDRSHYFSLGFTQESVSSSPARVGQITLQGYRRYVVGFGIDVHEDRRCSHPRNAAAGGKECVGAGDNGVSRSDLQSHQDGHERIRPGGNADGMWRTAILADRLLERCYFWPENKALADMDFAELRANRFSQRVVLFA